MDSPLSEVVNVDSPEPKGLCVLNKQELSGKHSPRHNHILAALPAADYARLLPDLELIPMRLGAAMYEAGGSLDYVYFPTTSVVSLLSELEDGTSAGIAVTGFDGLVGIALFLGGDNTACRAVVRSAGFGYRIRASVGKREFDLYGEFQRVVLLYTQVVITQMALTAVCNRHHTLEQRLCRWLLLNLDCLPTNELTMTQESIAQMLGVRREGVTEAAGDLRKAGTLCYNRGKITVLDRPRLEHRACECYAVVKKEMNRLLRYRSKPQGCPKELSPTAFASKPGELPAHSMISPPHLMKAHASPR
ncbi:MAG: Crp/Fnr family transcriptional regulator [Xanthomonadales bacterium]|nr:Crp/Fnr family transcriptional regulator [Xanthomonadales bacterium]